MIVIRRSGKTYNLFDSITLSKSLDNMTGAVTITTTLKNNLPLKKGDFIEVVVDEVIKLSGYIEKVSGDVSTDSSTVVYSCRDILGDLIDSSVPDSVAVNDKSMSLITLCKRTLAALNIKAEVVNRAGTISPFTAEEIEAVGFGDKAGAFLQSFARKRGVFLITEGNGNLIIYTPSTKVNQPKFTIDSMLPRSFSIDDSNRFNKVKVGSQDNNAASDTAEVEDGVTRTQTSTDSDIRGTRYLAITAEESMNNSELRRRADEEINIRRARGFEFSFDVPSHAYSIGDILPVEDELTGTAGIFLLRSVVYKQTNNTGNTSRLTICYPESYSTAGKRTTKRKSKIGEEKLVSTSRYLGQVQELL